MKPTKFPEVFLLSGISFVKGGHLGAGKAFSAADRLKVGRQLPGCEDCSSGFGVDLCALLAPIDCGACLFGLFLVALLLELLEALL